MSQRSPRPALTSRPLPTLAGLLAGAAALEGCAPIECGGARADELAAHGPQGAEALGRGELRRGLHEVAVAVGLVPHTATHVPPIAMGGAPPLVTQTPLQIQPPGGISAVTPEPPQDPPLAEGQIRRVTTTPAEPPQRQVRSRGRRASE